MALLRYFKPATKNKDGLPDPRGPLSKIMPSSSIASANSKVKAMTAMTSLGSAAGNKLGCYMKYTAEQKAEIGKRAAENGVVSAIQYFSKNSKYPNLKESSVRDWRNAYTHELKMKCRESNESKPVVTELLQKKRGRPLLLRNELDEYVKTYLHFIRVKGGVVNTAIAIACAKGIVINRDSNLLACNGGHIVLTKHWGKYLLWRMGLVKRKATTKAKVTVEHFENVKAQFLLDIKAIVEIEEVPSALVINWDQTGINYVPVSSWTMAKEGSKRVEIFGVDDKRQITGVFACNMDGDFMPIQIVYKGKTAKCLPKFSFPSDWHITYSHNHWSDESTMIHNVYFFHISRQKERN